MIRKQVIFKAENDYKLDYNYYHALQGVIYKLLEHSDKRLANKIHNKGYIYEDGRPFKLFNYALLFKKVKFKEQIEISKDSTIKLIISGKREIVENIIAALISLQEIRLFGLRLRLDDMRSDNKIIFQNIMLYTTLSPVSVSVYDDGIEYIEIFDPRYFNVLGHNLIKKYELIYGEKFEDELYFDLEDFLNVRDKSTRIKDGFVRQKEYEIWIETTPRMQRVAYYLGLGERSSIGMGCMGYLDGSDTDG